MQWLENILKFITFYKFLIENNMLKKSILLLFLLTFFSTFAQKYTEGTNFKFHSPTPGEITIMAVSPIPDDMEPTKQAFRDVVDCGFNLATSRGTVDDFRRIFSILGDDINLRYLVSNPKFIDRTTRQSYLLAFRNNPHLGGWLLKDEPLYDTWGDLSTQYKQFYKEAPNSFVYINLVGVIEKSFTGPYSSMNEYLEGFQKQFTPALWSYDYYPVYIQKGKLNVNYEHFYYVLTNFYNIAQKTQRPFWVFCESIAYTAPTYSRPAPTEEYLKFEAYNALAYGAQGIVYWSYSLRKPSGGENYTSALVDLKGSKSKAWYAAQKVNREIKRFNHVFYECDVKEVKHTGSKIYRDTQRLIGSIGPFAKITSQNDGVVVSRIENNGQKYIVIVNRNVFSKQKVTLKLAANKTVENLTSSSPTQYNPGSSVSLTLDKADWAIFREI